MLSNDEVYPLLHTARLAYLVSRAVCVSAYLTATLC